MLRDDVDTTLIILSLYRVQLNWMWLGNNQNSLFLTIHQKANFFELGLYISRKIVKMSFICSNSPTQCLHLNISFENGLKPWHVKCSNHKSWKPCLNSRFPQKKLHTCCHSTSILYSYIHSPETNRATGSGYFTLCCQPWQKMRRRGSTERQHSILPVSVAFKASHTALRTDILFCLLTDMSPPHINPSLTSSTLSGCKSLHNSSVNMNAGSMYI